MKKLSFIIILALFAQSTVIAQPCLPDGIVFSSQAEIDNFPTNYPNCIELEGDVTISGTDITNLNGLSVLNSIGGDLRINDNDALPNLTGLDNLSLIGGELKIQANDAMTSLTGLDNLTSIGGVLAILWNNTLTTLTALENLTSIGGLAIWNSNALTSLTGLEGLTSIGGRFYFVGNNAITNLVGLDNVTSIGGKLFIHSNDTLTNLTGLDNLSFINGNLELGDYNAPAGWIFGNPSLTSLAALSNLDSIAGGLAIYADTSLLDLTGLDGLTSLVFLTVHGNNALTSLTGLDNLTTIGGGGLSFDNNDALTNLTGLDNVTSIEGSLKIGATYHSYVGNPALTSLTGLDNLTFIGGSLFIYGNNALTSLTGLDSIGANSVTDLTIINNDSLSTCEVQSICDYLASPSSDIEIHDNATGCNDQQEVEAACAVSVDEVHRSEKLLIYPNPSTTQITIELPNAPQKNSKLAMYNINSQQILTSKITEQKTVVDISGLPSGFYFVQMMEGKEMTLLKIIKMR